MMDRLSSVVHHITCYMELLIEWQSFQT